MAQETSVELEGHLPGMLDWWRRRIPVEAILFGVVVLILWEVGVDALGITLFLPKPSNILQFVFENNGLFAKHGFLTLKFTIYGLVIGATVGMVLALLTAASAVIDRMMSPLVLLTFTTPKIVIAPIIVLYIGTTDTYFTLILILVAFFAIYENAKKGLEGVSREFRELSTLYHASYWFNFRKVQMPSILPHLMAGLKVSVMQALIGVIVAEFVAPRQGLGYLLMIGQNQQQPRMMFGSVAVIAAIGLTLYVIVDIIEGQVIFWRAT